MIATAMSAIPTAAIAATRPIRLEFRTAGTYTNDLLPRGIDGCLPCADCKRRYRGFDPVSILNRHPKSGVRATILSVCGVLIELVLTGARHAL